MKYLNVVVDNNTPATDHFFTYTCEDGAVRVGSKVRVPFARSRADKDAYVFEVLGEAPAEVAGEADKLKAVSSVDADVCLSAEAVDTAAWMRRRYLCRYIEAVSCFTPAGAKAKTGKKRNPYAGASGEQKAKPELNSEQQTVLDRILAAMAAREQKTFLLHGVTGSGKTEVYMRAIAETLAEGRTAIMMVPEISLTPQIIDRFIGRFGADKIAVLHSKLSPGERYDEWQRIASGEVRIVIGARSAVFAPLENIGLIVLDEEHEATYKSDQAPKYDTVEVAVRRAMHASNRALVLLGSATPSVVSYKRAKDGIYELLELKERYNKVLLPDIRVADMRAELKSGNRSVFSRLLANRMESCLESGKQVILFLNRRGYSTFVSCRSCGHVEVCPDCGIAMTYHRGADRLVCHYCGRTAPVPTVCPDCGSKAIKYFGTGTEKLEEAVAELFPNYKAARLDLDSIRRKGSLDKILKDFRDGEIRILLGTQLVAKGLDFANVGLVGIVAADVSLNIPDYRSAERTFQLVTQAAGRAGRGDERGEVVVQTYNPQHYAIETAVAQDYAGFYKVENLVRSNMEYPPYSDFIQISFLGEIPETAQKTAQSFNLRLTEALGDEGIFPPQPARIAKADGVYRWNLLLKCPPGQRRRYLAEIDAARNDFARKSREKVSVLVDVNPYSL